MRSGVSSDMALRLSRYFGTSPDVWIGLQADYDLYGAMMKSKKTIDEIKPLQGSKRRSRGKTMRESDSPFRSLRPSPKLVGFKKNSHGISSSEKSRAQN